MGLKRMLGRLLQKLLRRNRNASEDFCSTLKKRGITVGKGVIFYNPSSCVIDISNPALLTLGDNVRITHGVIILTHDYSWSVLAGAYGECLGGVAPVRIGSNVFVGMNAIILKGVTIGDNVIIGAGSVVTKDIPSNEVWAGNPARKIMDLDTYYQKKKQESFREALDLVRYIQENPDNSAGLMREYEPLFMDHQSDSVQILFRDTGYADKCNGFYARNKRRYNNFDEFKHLNSLDS